MSGRDPKPLAWNQDAALEEREFVSMKEDADHGAIDIRAEIAIRDTKHRGELEFVGINPRVDLSLTPYHQQEVE
jgi:hypothetical protein